MEAEEAMVGGLGDQMMYLGHPHYPGSRSSIHFQALRMVVIVMGGVGSMEICGGLLQPLPSARFAQKSLIGQILLTYLAPVGSNFVCSAITESLQMMGGVQGAGKHTIQKWQ